MSFAKPQNGLVPIGGNFYATPDEPQEPNYENPFANPIGTNGIKPPIGVELDVVRDECNIGLQYNATLLFMRLPAFQLVLRNSSCVPPPIEEEPLPPPDTEQPTTRPSRCDINGERWQVSFTSHRDFYLRIFEGGQQLTWKGTHTFELVGFQEAQPSNFDRIFTAVNATDSPQGAIFDFRITRKVKADMYGSPDENQSAIVKCFAIRNVGANNAILYPVDPLNIGLFESVVANAVTDVSGGFSATINRLFSGEPASNTASPFLIEQSGADTDNYQTLHTGVETKLVLCAGMFDNPPPPDPPPPPRKKPPKECCMCCEGQKNNDQLLRLLLKRVGDFPATVPAKLNTGNNKNATTKVESIGAMLGWLAINIDAMVGEFPLSIKIEDSDLTKSGNQAIEVKSPNIAETLSEILGLLLVIKTEGGATLKTSLNAMIETGAIRQTVASNYDYLDGIAEYLGFQIKQINKSLPLAFTPGKEKLDELLEPSTLKYKTVENVDKKDINDTFAVLLEMAARWNAQNFRNLGTSNTKGNLRDLLRDGVNIGEKVRDLVNLEKVKNNDIDLVPESTFDRFIEDAETQFSGTDGATDISNPWGKDYSQRPKIRQIGKTSQGDK